MTGQNTISDSIRFHCSVCRAELSVPAVLAGVEGPCPSCGETIHAPIPEATYTEVEDLPAVPWMTQGAARQKEFSGHPMHHPTAADTEGVRPVFPSPEDKNFRARLAIPSPDGPLDDTWKERHRDMQRQTRRVRKAEKVAQSFLDSRTFRVARMALILLTAGMFAWLFTYLQTHQWRLPGMAPGLATEQPATIGTSRPAGSDANVFTADDDTEIPPAASVTPAPAGSATPVAAKPR